MSHFAAGLVALAGVGCRGLALQQPVPVESTVDKDWPSGVEGSIQGCRERFAILDQKHVGQCQARLVLAAQLAVRFVRSARDVFGSAAASTRLPPQSRARGRKPRVTGLLRIIVQVNPP